MNWIEQNWPWLLVALGVVLLAVALLRRGRGQRVSLTERDPSTRTLERPAAITPVGPAPRAVQSELTRLKGVGPKLAAALHGAGYSDLKTLAALDDGQHAALDAKLGSFSGRLTRDRLVEQARLLSTDPAAYEAAFGKQGSSG